MDVAAKEKALQTMSNMSSAQIVSATTTTSQLHPKLSHYHPSLSSHHHHLSHLSPLSSCSAITNNTSPSPPTTLNLFHHHPHLNGYPNPGVITQQPPPPPVSLSL